MLHLMPEGFLEMLLLIRIVIIIKFVAVDGGKIFKLLFGDIC